MVRFDGREVFEGPEWIIDEGFGYTQGYGSAFYPHMDWTVTHERDGWAKCQRAYDLWFPVSAVVEVE